MCKERLRAKSREHGATTEGMKPKTRECDSLRDEENSEDDLKIGEREIDQDNCARPMILPHRDLPQDHSIQ